MEYMCTCNYMQLASCFFPLPLQVIQHLYHILAIWHQLYNVSEVNMYYGGKYVVRPVMVSE